MKRNPSLLLLALLLLSLLAYVSVTALDTAKEPVLSYEIQNGEATVTRCSRSATGKVVIPETIGDGIPVTAVGAHAFTSCEGVTEVLIPATVKRIIGDAFAASGLRSVTIPAGVEEMGDMAFSGCESLESVAVTEGARAVDGFTFCPQLRRIEIPSSVTSIGGFEGCSALSEVILHPSTQKVTVRSRAFYGCPLTEISLPEGVTCIEDDAFGSCTFLSSISLPQTLREVGDGVFDGSAYAQNPANWQNGSLYIDSCLLKAAVTAEGRFTVREGTRAIADAAFSGCTHLTQIDLPNGITYIGKYAFNECASLLTLSLPESVAKIGAAAFYGCSALTALSLPSSLTEIPEQMLAYCSSLSSLSLPSSVTVIGRGAFEGCTALSTLILPEGLSHIGEDILTGSALYENRIRWQDGAFYHGGYLLGTKEGLQGTLTVKPGTVLIADGTFYGQSGLSDIRLPDGLTLVGEYAFHGCTGLSEIVLPTGVKQIGMDAFSECTALRRVTLPDTLSLVEAFAFSGCDAIAEVIFSGSPDSWQRVVFENEMANPTFIHPHSEGVRRPVRLTFLSADVGDVDMSKSIDGGDERLLRRYLTHATALSAPQLALSDLNGDGTVCSRDLVLLLRLIRSAQQ